MNVVIADDNPQDRYLLKFILENQGHQVREFANGKQALDAIRLAVPELVISDILMPVMDGYALLRAIRQDEQLRHLPFILHTATYTQDEDREFASRLGADTFLLKPADPDTLSESIDEVVASARKRDLTEHALLAASDYYIEYNQRLVAKLEDKLLQLEQANRALRAKDEDNRRLLNESREATRLRDEFLSVAAHELKTPVTSLRGYAQTMLRQFVKRGTAEPEQLQKALKGIEGQSVKLENLILQLLDTARLDNGKLQLQPQTADLAALVQSIVAAMIERTDRHQITAQTPADCIMQFDPLRIEQVLINLLDNSVRYSPNGGTISVEVVSAPPGWVQISISDEGIGITPEQIPHIFNRFYQTQQSDYRGGMGLGLFISQQIVRLHGGHIEVDSTREKGARFVIHLPSGG
jgi:signal transduction histidine kinase